MRLGVLIFAVLASVGAVLGQAASIPRNPADAGGSAGERRPGSSPQADSAQPIATRDDATAILRDHGNSLLKASLAARPDASQARLRDISFTAVPVPEPKVIKKHDLVTIVVREESKFSSEGSSETKREASIDAAIEEFIKLRLRNLEIEGGGIGPVAPKVAANLNRESKGEGTVDRSDRFTARITAEVLDVKPNGTLVLQARKRIKTDDEEQAFILTGVCRAGDITADNSILSTQLYDLELSKSHKGTVRNATRKGWGGKLLDAISPF